MRRTSPRVCGSRAETALGAVCVTGDSTNASLAAAKRCADAAGYATIGGAGNGSSPSRVARRWRSWLWASLWDTCAPEAVLRAAGGRLRPLRRAARARPRAATSPGRLINEGLGVLATGRDLAARDVRARGGTTTRSPRRCAATTSCAPRSDQVRRGGEPREPEETNGEAFDVARCLDGAPLEASWVGARVSEALKGGVNGGRSRHGRGIVGDSRLDVGRVPARARVAAERRRRVRGHAGHGVLQEGRPGRPGVRAHEGEDAADEDRYGT